MQHHLSGQFQQIVILLHKDRRVATWIERPDHPEAAVKALRIKTIQLPHPSRSIAVDRCHQPMIMVGHPTIRVDDPVETLKTLPRTGSHSTRSSSVR
ncbi:MAG: hypothetical protein ACRERU_19610 [Methylococcales bacterium]